MGASRRLKTGNWAIPLFEGVKLTLVDSFDRVDPVGYALLVRAVGKSTGGKKRKNPTRKFVKPLDVNRMQRSRE